MLKEVFCERSCQDRPYRGIHDIVCRRVRNGRSKYFVGYDKLFQLFWLFWQPNRDYRDVPY